MAESEESRPIITVFGATGAQGGAALRALVRTDTYSIRAVTRSPDKAPAKALAAISCVTVVKADLADESSIKSAIEGAYGVFLVTNYWAHLSEETEKKQVKVVLDACNAAKVEHIVWSTLDNTKGTYKPIGKLTHVPHFQCKYDMDEQFPKESTTFLRCSFYMENLVGMMKPSKNEDGTYTVTIPMGGQKMHMVNTEQIGNVVAKAFMNPDTSKGQVLIAVSDKVSCSEIAQIMSEVSGKDVKPYEPSNEEYAGYYPDQGSEDIANMFQFYMESKDYQNIRDAALAGSKGDFKYPAGLPFRAWLYDSKFVLPE